jgi:hypothetical protein
MPICFVPAVINRLFCCAILLVIGSCAGEKKQEAPKKTPITEAPILVARIQSRPGGKDFVLLESYEKWTLEDGVNLFSTGSDGSTAALVTSGEMLGQFVAADLISGHVEIGDAVYFRPKQTAQVAEQSSQQPKMAAAGLAVPAKPVASENEIKPVPPAGKPLFELPKW